MWWGESLSPELGDGSAAIEKGPGLYDTREFPDINLEDSKDDAGAWDNCTIEKELNERRKELWMQELFNPECNTDELDKDLEMQFDNLS